MARRAPSAATEAMLRKAAEARVESLQAQLTRSLNALHELVRYVDHAGGWMAPNDQQTLRIAKATLAAAGRSV